MIEMKAITIGTKARNEAKTNASTSSAPTPPITASRSTPGPSLSPPLSSASASKPVRCTGLAATCAPLTARLAAFGLGVLAELGIRVRPRVDDGEERAPVLGDEALVAGGRVGGDPRPPAALLEPGVELLQVRPDVRRVHALALRQRDHREERRAAVAVAVVALGDLDVGLPALLVGDGELGLERVRGGPGGHEPGNGQHDPRDYDRALVGEDPASQRRHELPPGGRQPTSTPDRAPRRAAISVTAEAT